MRSIYMDANATTPCLPEVVEAMRPFWTEAFGNASSTHRRGQGARAAVDGAREQVAGMLGCRAAEVIFTSGGTESDNLAIFGVLQPMLQAGERAHLVTTAIEHHAVLHAAKALEERGAEVTILQPTADGVILPASLREVLRPETKLVSVMLANNETGVIQPIGELAAIAHAGGALFHTDAVQGAGKIAMRLGAGGELGQVDLLSLSGHKMYAPQGTGVLFARRATRLTPLFFGGMHERGRRPGTENVPGIVGLGKAAEMASAWLAVEAHAAQMRGLRDRLERGILTQVSDAGVHGGGAERVPNTSNLFFDGVDAEALLIALDLQGLAISAGSACQSGATEPSHVLTAMGMMKARARGSVRISLTRTATEEQVDRAAGMVIQTVNRMRALAATA